MQGSYPQTQSIDILTSHSELIQARMCSYQPKISKNNYIFHWTFQTVSVLIINLISLFQDLLATDIPVVSTNWIIQCTINNARIAYNNFKCKLPSTWTFVNGHASILFFQFEENFWSWRFSIKTLVPFSKILCFIKYWLLKVFGKDLKLHPRWCEWFFYLIFF